jgi:hypothetical protein
VLGLEYAPEWEVSLRRRLVGDGVVSEDCVKNADKEMELITCSILALDVLSR